MQGYLLSHKDQPIFLTEMEDIWEYIHIQVNIGRVSTRIFETDVKLKCYAGPL